MNKIKILVISVILVFVIIQCQISNANEVQNNNNPNYAVIKSIVKEINDLVDKLCEANIDNNMKLINEKLLEIKLKSLGNITLNIEKGCLLNCALCNNTGKSNNSNICFSCGGDGYVLFEGSEANAKHCKYCKGIGKAILYGYEGRNSYQKKPNVLNQELTACPACNGSGWANVKK